MKYQYLFFLFVITIVSTVYGQKSINAIVVDSITQKAIPYAAISFNKEQGVISNEVGNFQINIKRKIKLQDSIFVSFLGYETKQFAVTEFKDSIIYIIPKIIELNEVIVTDKKYTIDEIIDKVKENLEENYYREHFKGKLFFRESYYMDMVKSQVNLKKSTIPEFNQMFVDSLISALPRKSDTYTEVLGTLYGKLNDNDPQKLEIIKASELYDKNDEMTFEAYEKKINGIIKKRIKRDSYFKIRSGLFATKEEMDTTLYDGIDRKELDETEQLIEQQRKNETEKRENFLKYRRNIISEQFKHSFIYEDSELNFIEKSNKYKFELLEYAYLNDNFVYKISFRPKRGADYKGYIYVNLHDFAIERVDFENVKSLKKLNLLGLSFNQYLLKGTLIYVKNDKNKYMLKFADMSMGVKMGVKRPLKIIEKNKNVKGRRKQNELSGKIHFIMGIKTKRELVVFDNEVISKKDFDQISEEANVKPTYLSDYDPEFWEGHDVIEPNQAIMDFKSLE